MSADPVAVIYSASLSGAFSCAPGPDGNPRTFASNQNTASKAWKHIRFEKVPVPTGSPSALRYSLRNLRLVTALVDSSALC